MDTFTKIITDILKKISIMYYVLSLESLVLKNTG